MFSYFSYGEKKFLPKGHEPLPPLNTPLSNTETISHSVHGEFFTLWSGIQRGGRQKQFGCVKNLFLDSRASYACGELMFFQLQNVGSVQAGEV